MGKVASLVKRNMWIYTRNRTNVISSLITMVIIVILMTVFLGDMTTDSIVDVLKQYGGPRDSVADKTNATIYMLNWIIAGLMLVNSVTVSYSVVGIMMEDMEKGKLNSMFIAPVKRSVFVFSYVISGFLVSVAMCVLTMVAAEIIIVLQGGALLSVISMLKIFGILLVVAFVFSGFSFLCVLAVNSSSAFSHIGTLVGTLVGFMAAIYIPVGGLPKGVTNVLKYLPTLVGSSLFREEFTRAITEKTFDGIPAEVVSEMSKSMGTTLYYGDNEASFWLRMAILILSGILFLGIAIVLMRRKHIADR